MLSKHEYKAWEEKKIAKNNHDVKQIRLDSMEIFKQIQQVSPAFAKNLVQKNEIINRFIFQNYGDMNILERPICKHCESMGAYDKDGSVYCFACNRKSWYPPGQIMTVRKYLMEELNHKGLDEIQLIMLNQLAKEREEVDDGGRIKIIGV